MESGAKTSYESEDPDQSNIVTRGVAANDESISGTSLKERRKSLRYTGREHVTAPPTGRLRRDILSRKGHVFTFDEDHIFKATQHHIAYTHNGVTLKGLEKYLDCTEYGISEKSEQNLLKLEISRLVTAARQTNALLFDSGNVNAITDDTAFEDLANIADQLKCSVDIVKLDLARVALMNYTEDQEATLENFRLSRRRLNSRFNDDQTRVEGSEPKMVDPPERNKLLYFALVDFVTASIARLTVRVASCKYWNQQILSCLACWAVKLKVLSYDQRKFATFCIQTAEHAIEQKTQSFASKQALFIKIKANDENSQDKDIDTLDTDTDTSGRYHAEKTLFNGHIRRLIRSVLTDLLVTDDKASSASCFEMSSMIYKAGMDGSLTTLSSSRDGEISASSDALRLKCSFTALMLLSQNLQAIRISPNVATRSDPSIHGKRAKIKWEWENIDLEGTPQRATLWTANINHVLTVVVSLSLSSTFVTNTLDLLVNLAGSGTDDEDPVLQFEAPSKNARALVTLSTANWLVKEEVMQRSQFRDDEIASLANSPMRFGIKVGATLLRRATENELSLGHTVTQSTDPEIMAQYRHDKAYMDTWNITEDSVIIHCHTYIQLIIALALLIVCGGIAIPFCVGGKIRGVDPFQLTTFSWLLAGFITIVGKSRYVNEWPWHDFLHGRVVCHDVEDVVDVTGVDAQRILMYLLLEERNTTLRTKGPYNGMFSRRTEDGSGFAINKASHISTMLASGFVVLKVLNEYGEHLTCLDVRKGSKGQLAAVRENAEHLACLDLDNDERIDGSVKESHQGSWFTFNRVSEKKVRNANKVRKLVRRNFRINRVLGVYIRDSRFG